LITRTVGRTGAVALLAVGGVLAGCTGSSDLSSARQRPAVTSGVPMPNEALPAASPAFTQHFTDPLYEDPADEFAPFGSDEGSDLLYEWDERRDELTSRTTVADLLEDAPVSAADLDDPEDVDSAVFASAAGFTLLRLTGHIDDAGKTLALKALDVLIRYYDSPPELLKQRDDLKSWRN
jgi:hypothetical protein